MQREAEVASSTQEGRGGLLLVSLRQKDAEDDMLDGGGGLTEEQLPLT